MQEELVGLHLWLHVVPFLLLLRLAASELGGPLRRGGGRREVGGWRGIGRSGSADERVVLSEKVRLVKGIDGAGVFLQSEHVFACT
jgi:hypothetical protein